MRRSGTDKPFKQPKWLEVIEGPSLRSGTMIISGFMPAGALVPNGYEIPYFDPRTRKGYQRLPQDARINQLANDLKKDRVDLPTAILLNIRNREATRALSAGKLDLQFLHTGSLPIKLFVVDGQHRVLALQKLIAEARNEEELNTWSSFQMPFVCMLGASEEEEMEQFYIVNSTAKSVRTDLALSLLKKRVELDPDVLVGLQERRREWLVDGQTIVERLAVSSPIWKHQIRLPAMDKGGTTISSASMVASLKPLLNSPYFGALRVDQQVRVLEAFWQGVRDVLRPAFDDSTEFAVQKGVGVIVLHTVLPHILEVVRTNGWPVTEADSYSRILKEPLIKLEGDNGEGNPVSGVDFWAAAPKGAAGSYSSSAGRRVLIAKIRQVLPDVQVE